MASDCSPFVFDPAAVCGELAAFRSLAADVDPAICGVFVEAL